MIFRDVTAESILKPLNLWYRIRPTNQITLSVHNEMLTLINFNDNISIVNRNEVTQFLLNIINNAFKLRYPIRTKPYLLKTQLNHGFQGRFLQLSRKSKTIIHLLAKIKCPFNSMHDV